MHFRLQCECGQAVSVTEGAAGLSLPCTCGRNIQVPAFAELRGRAASGEIPWSLYADGEGPPPPPNPVAEGARTVLRGVVFLAGGLLFILGACLFVGNITGLFRTFPFAGYVTMAVGIGLLGLAARARARGDA